MKKLCSTLILMLVLLFVLPITVQAKTKCYSKIDTNELDYGGFDFMSEKNLVRAYKSHQIWVPGIKVKQSKRKVTISYQDVPEAGGYEIRYSTKIRNKGSDAAKVVKGAKINTKALSQKIVVHGTKRVYIQIRPYKVIHGKKVHGRWSSVYADGKRTKISAIKKWFPEKSGKLLDIPWKYLK